LGSPPPQELLAPLPVERDEQWGLDHGAWGVLCYAFPHADILIVQLMEQRNEAGVRRPLPLLSRDFLNRPASFAPRPR
jgi:hypothetical protein